jgi:hypothetical protein
MENAVLRFDRGSSLHCLLALYSLIVLCDITEGDVARSHSAQSSRYTDGTN